MFISRFWRRTSGLSHTPTKPLIALILNELAMKRRLGALFNAAKLAIICLITKHFAKFFSRQIQEPSYGAYPAIPNNKRNFSDKDTRKEATRRSRFLYRE